MVRIFLGMRDGRYDEREVERQLQQRPLMNRFLGRHVGRVRTSWHTYPRFHCSSSPGAPALDGSFMNFAYGWAFAKPVRKLYYNITITGVSAAVDGEHGPMLGSRQEDRPSS